MVAWMLDIDVRATIKKREFQRTYQRMCLYIKHMERMFVRTLEKPDNH
jgi:hypothetical protein